MARPRVVKVFGGEVVIKNLPKDKQDQIAEYVEALVSNTKEVPTIHIEDESVDLKLSDYDANIFVDALNNDLTVNQPLTELALGLHKDSSGIYSIVDVKYNINTKQALVESVTSVGKYKDVATSDFKVKVAKKLM